MLLRWELDVEYAGYQLNAVTVVSVNSELVGHSGSKAFLTARQVSAPMGVALAAFAVSGVASLILAGSKNGIRSSGAATQQSSYCVVVGLSDGFY